MERYAEMIMEKLDTLIQKQIVTNNALIELLSLFKKYDGDYYKEQEEKYGENS
jgi:hypothetical protein